MANNPTWSMTTIVAVIAIRFHSRDRFGAAGNGRLRNRLRRKLLLQFRIGGRIRLSGGHWKRGDQGVALLDSAPCAVFPGEF